jgi:hypothetical protein
MKNMVCGLEYPMQVIPSFDIRHMGYSAVVFHRSLAFQNKGCLSAVLHPVLVEINAAAIFKPEA